MFINMFDNLLNESKQTLSQEYFQALNQQAYDSAIKFREFKLSILTNQITDKITISLPPTFINHMVNEFR